MLLKLFIYSGVDDELKTPYFFRVQYEFSQPVKVENIKTIVLHGTEIDIR